MVSIQGMTVKTVGEVPMDQEAAAVAITPDGKRAFVCMNLVNKVGVLAIDGQNVTYDKSLDIPAAFNPYNIDVTPDGKYVIVSNTGAQGFNADAEVDDRGDRSASARGRPDEPRQRARGLRRLHRTGSGRRRRCSWDWRQAQRLQLHEGRASGADVDRVRWAC